MCSTKQSQLEDWGHNADFYLECLPGSEQRIKNHEGKIRQKTHGFLQGACSVWVLLWLDSTAPSPAPTSGSRSGGLVKKSV